MLDTLEREYRAAEDIHEKLKIYSDDEIQKILIDRLEQLDENKQNFLRVRFRRFCLSASTFVSRLVLSLGKNPIFSTSTP